MTKVRIYAETSSRIRSINFKTGYNVDFTYQDGKRGKIREFTKSEISYWLKRVVEDGVLDKAFAKEVRRQIKELA